MIENDINLHIVLVQAWIYKHGKFLMSQRSLLDKQAPGMWSIPGGKVDLDLGPNVVENTLKKEILEEVNLRIQGNLKYLGSQSFIRSSGHHVVSLTFIAMYKSGKAKPLEDQEAVKWMTVEEIEATINFTNGPQHFAPFIIQLKQFVSNQFDE